MDAQKGVIYSSFQAIYSIQCKEAHGKCSLTLEGDEGLSKSVFFFNLPLKVHKNPIFGSLGC